MATASPSKNRKPRAAKKAPDSENEYEVLLRPADGPVITAKVRDRVLYPIAVAWNRLLSSDQGREVNWKTAAQTWRARGHDAILQLAETGGVEEKDARAFLRAAATSGLVQVEIPWSEESVGWAARIFPWEALLALATKTDRARTERQDFLVVRWLKGAANPVEKRGSVKVGFAVAADAASLYDTRTEHAAIEAALPAGSLHTLSAGTFDDLKREIETKHPEIVHYVPMSGDEVDEAAKKEAERVSQAIAGHAPDLAVFSSCYTGRRMAPLAVAHGARFAVGFHGFVTDSSIPAFFGAFYRSWEKRRDPLAALRAGLDANKAQPNPEDLGTVTLWSSKSLLGTVRQAALPPPMPEEVRTGTGKGGALLTSDILDALLVTCRPSAAVNYAMLHNRRGGLFLQFDVNKIKPIKLPDLEVGIRLDTGLDRPAECHFYVPLPDEASRRVDLAAKVNLPLGSQLLRQRGETLLGSLEVTVTCGEARVAHSSNSISLPPCDEWLDTLEARMFLPSFVFPRDPAVREIVSAAQPALKALADDPRAGFDGYQGGFVSDLEDAVSFQTRALWAALQHTYRLDYVNPPPSYASSSQRIRTPEEVLRARRGTCIELALLLSSCWEHVGIFPVVFLVKGHAFAGYWASAEARDEFKKLGNLLAHAAKNAGPAGENALGGVRTTRQTEPWALVESHHLAAIRGAARDKQLIPVEATFLPLQRSFKEAVAEGRELLGQLRGVEDFDGMLDVQTAREAGVTPLAIIHQGVVA